MVDLPTSGHHPILPAMKLQLMAFGMKAHSLLFPLLFQVFSFFPVQIFIDRPANNLGNCQPCLSRQTLKPHDLQVSKMVIHPFHSLYIIHTQTRLSRRIFPNRFVTIGDGALSHDASFLLYCYHLPSPIYSSGPIWVIFLYLLLPKW